MKLKKFTIHFPDSELELFGIREPLQRWRRAQVMSINILSCNPNEVYGTVSLREKIDVDDTPVGRLDVFKLLAKKDHGFTYLFKMSPPDISEESDGCPTELFCEGELEITNHGIDLTAVAPQPIICLIHDELHDRQVSFEVQQLTSYTGEEDPSDLLTERQIEVLQCAYEMGYFNIPRTVTMSDIADQFQLNKSTISEHLQRAERKVLANFC